MMNVGAVLGFILLAISLFGPALGQQTAADWLDKGYALDVQGRYDEAIQAYDKAIELNPQLAGACIT